MVKKQINAFTLAEVLITLAVIGVVAAMTLSVVINKYQANYLQRRFEKSYNTMAQAIQKSYSDFGYVANCGYYHDNSNNSFFDGCPSLNEQILKNLNIVKKCETSKERANCNSHLKGVDKVGLTSNFGGLYSNNINLLPTYILQDGMMYFPFDTLPFYIIDTNGKKGPNKWGYDIFVFYIAWQKFRCYVDLTEPGGTDCSERRRKIGR